MSFKVLGWAEDAPVIADVHEWAILMMMAARVDDDGCGAWLSVPTMAKRTRCSVDVVKGKLRAMRERGLIGYGDQSRNAHIPANRRSKVYDILVPVSAYTAHDLRKVNGERAEKGLPPLTARTRPDLPVPEPSRKQRSDYGVPRESADDQPMNCGNDQGVLEATPGDHPLGDAGGATSTVQGGLVATPGGCYEHPNYVLMNQSLEPVQEGGYVVGDRHLAPEQPGNTPTPSKPMPGRPDTWKCDRHLANPDPEDRPCGPCRAVRERCQARQAELDREAALAARSEQAERILAEREAREERQRQFASTIGGAGHQEFRETLAAIAAKPKTLKSGGRPPRIRRRAAPADVPEQRAEPVAAGTGGCAP